MNERILLSDTIECHDLNAPVPAVRLNFDEEGHAFLKEYPNS